MGSEALGNIVYELNLAFIRKGGARQERCSAETKAADEDLWAGRIREFYLLIGFGGSYCPRDRRGLSPKLH